MPSPFLLESQAVSDVLYNSIIAAVAQLEKLDNRLQKNRWHMARLEQVCLTFIFANNHVNFFFSHECLFSMLVLVSPRNLLIKYS